MPVTQSIRPKCRDVTPEVRPVRTCEVCGIPATEVTLIGLKNDRRREGPRYCLPHHPDSLNGRLH
jgi:hypothetical protein